LEPLAGLKDPVQRRLGALQKVGIEVVALLVARSFTSCAVDQVSIRGTLREGCLDAGGK
jgi:hypothetical protein